MTTLLIVDDSEDLLYGMQRLLSFYNFIVRGVKDGKALANEFGSFKPDIVIIDVLLNGEDGRKICKALREDPANREVTLILFSASPKHLIDFQEYGADGCIEKPFGIAELIHSISIAVQNHKIKFSQ